MYTLQALWTQAREKLDVTTVLLSNRKYQILIGELANVGANPGRTALDMLDLGNPDLDWTEARRAAWAWRRRAPTPASASPTCSRQAERAQRAVPDRTGDLSRPLPPTPPARGDGMVVKELALPLAVVPERPRAHGHTGLLLCPCGSGLRAVRCCSLQLGRLPPAEATRHLVPLVERAIQAHRQGADETAERLCLDVLELAPDRPGALSVLYEIRKAQGNAHAAEALIRRIVALDPNNLVATNELALILLGKGSLAEAEIHARNAVRIAPENPQAHNLMGMIMTEANRPQIGEYHYRRVLELTGAARSDPARQPRLEPEEPGPHGGGPRAVRGIRRRRAGNPPDPARLRPAGGGRPQFRRRRRRCSTRLDTLFPNDPGVRLTRAVLLGRMRRYDEALALIDGRA